MAGNWRRLGADEPRMNEQAGTELATGNSNANTERKPQPPRKGDDIAERLLALGAAVIKLLDPLSQRPGAKNLVKQLERCGAAGGANYEEAHGAESPADFVHKVRIALKEVRETRYWLRLVLQAGLLEPEHLIALIEEAGELVAILTASANTARRRTEQRT
jgi:four helix bundle protein